jgi:predicted nuclease of predicted toxin-antitoxin system
MKILFDENLPHGLRHLLPGHGVFTASYMKWSGLENGSFIKAAAADGFDAILTMDVGVEYQQYLPGLAVAVFIIKAPTNKLDDIRPIVPDILSALNHLIPRSLVRVG